MTNRIRQLLSEMAALENQLQTALHEQEGQVLFKIRGRRIEFERAVREKHRQLRTGLLTWLRQSRLQAVVSVPFIYSVAIPIVLLDVWITLYQAICFPLYGMAKVRRSGYIVIDRHHLGYLNSIEKFNCVYCGYSNGVIAYVREVAARTEQYWCPIKHARKVLGTHSRYAQFLAYGDAADYQARLDEFRNALAEERVDAAPVKEV
jgi:hypothetical protein